MDRLKKYGNMTPRDNVVLRFVDHNICGPLIYPRPLQGSTLLKINELSVLWICSPRPLVRGRLFKFTTFDLPLGKVRLPRPLARGRLFRGRGSIKAQINTQPHHNP